MKKIRKKQIGSAKGGALQIFWLRFVNACEYPTARWAIRTHRDETVSSSPCIVEAPAAITGANGEEGDRRVSQVPPAMCSHCSNALVLELLTLPFPAHCNAKRIERCGTKFFFITSLPSLTRPSRIWSKTTNSSCTWSSKPSYQRNLQKNNYN